MIYEAFISPNERPNTLLEIKRALLTFDKVHISDPNDRDYFPPQQLMMALGIPPILGFNMGPVRPLGKYKGFDNDFDKLMDDLKIARRENLIDVTSSYDLKSTDQMTLGAVHTGNYPLNPQFLLWAYRNIGRDTATLTSAIKDDTQLFEMSDEDIDFISLSNSAADGEIIGDPALPMLEGSLSREHLRPQFSNIAKARLAAVIKIIGYCVSKQMVPFFGSTPYCALASQIAKRANDVIDKISDHDPYWATRSQMLRVAHEEYIDETVLGGMSIDDVLRLRTAAWGKQAAAREEMFQSIAELSKEISNKSDFIESAQSRIAKYRATAEDIEKQRSNLKLKIKCDVVKAVGGVFSGGGVALSGVLTQAQTAIGAGTTLFAGCLYAADKIKEYNPVIRQLKAAEQEFKDDAAYGLNNFYMKMESASKP